MVLKLVKRCYDLALIFLISAGLLLAAMPKTGVLTESWKSSVCGVKPTLSRHNLAVVRLTTDGVIDTSMPYYKMSGERRNEC